MTNYFQPDSTGFYLAVHSWKILKDLPNTPPSKSKVGTTLYRENAASEFVRPFLPEVASNTKLEATNRKLFKKTLIQSAELSGILAQASWRLEGTFSEKKGGGRPQTVTSDWEEAVEMLKAARGKQTGLKEATVESLISRDRAREVVSVESDLTENNWHLPKIVEHLKKTRYNPNLPEIALEPAVLEHLKWAEVQTQTPMSKDNPAPRMSIHTLRARRRYLDMVVRFFGPETTLAYLKSGPRIQAFCQGSEPIPMPTVLNDVQKRSRGKSAYGNTKRPWSDEQAACCASHISGFLEWASTPGIPHPNGVMVYLPPLDEEADLWFPEIENDGTYLFNAKTGNPYQYRLWIDVAWPTRLAARVALETFAGLRPAEISARDSSINWEESLFWVGHSCKTGHRIVPLMDNLMTMLLFLKKEGRLYLGWDENSDKRALTMAHAKMGYDAADCIIEAGWGNVEEFRKQYPIRFYSVMSKETGRDELEPWGYWTKKCPRHTFGSVVYEASLRNAGIVAGLLGHKESTFLDAYAGKVHAGLWHGSVYRACRSFCQCLPKQLRAWGIRERHMEIPAWFLLKPDDKMAENRRRLKGYVDKALANADERTRRQAQALEKGKTFIREIGELATKLDVDRATIRKWTGLPGFPAATANGFILEDVQAWATANNLPPCTGMRASKLKSTTLPDGRTVIPRWVDLAEKLRVNANTLKGNWARLPDFPQKTLAGHVLEDVRAWLDAKGHKSRLPAEQMPQRSSIEPDEPHAKHQSAGYALGAVSPDTEPPARQNGNAASTVPSSEVEDDASATLDQPQPETDCCLPGC